MLHESTAPDVDSLGAVHVVLAPDSFTGTLTAHQAAEAMARGWAQAAPHDLLTLVPLSDGGPGFVDVLASALPQARTLALTVTDPLGREVPAALLLVDGDEGPTAYVEAAQAAGLHLLAADERNPGVTSSWGVGQLLDAALTEGATTVVVGVGGSATHDGGAGMLAALGVGTPEDLARGGLALGRLTDGALAGVEAAARTAGRGAPGAGHRRRAAAARPAGSERRGRATAGCLARAGPAARERAGPLGGGRAPQPCPETTDLLTGRPRRLDKEPGAGAGGGLGHALLPPGGAPVRAASRRCVRAVGLPGLLAAADLVVTGEGSFDWQSLHGRVVAGVAAAALDVATPCVVVAGQVLVGRREAMTLGLSGSYAVAESPEQVAAAMADPVGTLATRTARVAATWSPPPR